MLERRLIQCNITYGSEASDVIRKGSNGNGTRARAVGGGIARFPRNLSKRFLIASRSVEMNLDHCFIQNQIALFSITCYFTELFHQNCVAPNRSNRRVFYRPRIVTHIDHLCCGSYKREGMHPVYEYVMLMNRFVTAKEEESNNK